MKNAPLELLETLSGIVYERANNRVVHLKQSDDFIELADNPKLQKRLRKREWVYRTLIKTNFSPKEAAYASGFKELGDMLDQHMKTEMRYVGPISEFLGYDAPRIIGKKKWLADIEPIWGYTSTKKGKFNKISDPSAPKEEVVKAKKFISKAFKVKIKVNKEGVKEWFYDGLKEQIFNKQGKDISPPEVKVVHLSRKIMESNPRHFKQISRFRFNEAEYERLVKENNINFFDTKKEFYVPERLTKEMLENYNPELPEFQKAILERSYVIREQMALEQHGKKFEKASTQKKAEMTAEFEELALMKSRIELDNQMNFKPSKLKPTVLIERQVHKLPLTVIGKNGKVIKVWETGAEATHIPHSIAWGKLLANMQHAPFTVGIKGFSNIDIIKGMDSLLKRKTGSISPEERAIYNYFKLAIRERTGTAERDILHPTGRDISKDATALVLKGQLGGIWPFAGLRNFFDAMSQNFQYVPMHYTAISLVKAFSSLEQSKTRRRGGGSSNIGLLAHEVGKTAVGKTFKRSWAGRVWDRLFKMGGIPISDNYIRTVGRLNTILDVGQMDVRRLLPKDSKKFKNMHNRLSDIYHLTDAQRNLFVEWGPRPNPQSIPKNIRESVLLELENIDRQMQLTGNIMTAGTTVEGALPRWMSIPMVKPAVLYQSIARQQLDAAARMMQHNRRNGNMMRLGMFIGGPLIAGTARVALLGYLAGKVLPHQSKEWDFSDLDSLPDNLKRLTTVLWAGNFLGFLSPFFSPYAPWRSGELNPAKALTIENNPFFEPALGTVAMATLGGLADIIGWSTGAWTTEKFVNENVNDVLRSFSQPYGQLVNEYELLVHPHTADIKKINIWNKDFNNQHVYVRSNNYEKMESTKWIRHLKNVFNKTDLKDEKVVEEVFKEIANVYWMKAAEAQGRGETETQAFKTAETRISKILTDLNPIPYSIDPKKEYVMDMHPLKMFLASLNDDQLVVTARAYATYKNKLTALGLEKKKGKWVYTKFNKWIRESDTYKNDKDIKKRFIEFKDAKLIDRYQNAIEGFLKKKGVDIYELMDAMKKELAK